jgi:hypothetical protein
MNVSNINTLQKATNNKCGPASRKCSEILYGNAYGVTTNIPQSQFELLQLLLQKRKRIKPQRILI